MFSHDLHAYVRALMGPDALRVGPFLAGIDPHDDTPFRNYAVPDDDADPSPGGVADLVAAFTARGRTPRLEYLPQCAPKLADTLCANGFRPERTLPVLTCAAGEVVVPAAVAGVELRLAVTEADLRAAAAVQNVAYGVPAVTEHDVARLAGTVAGGGLVGLAVGQDGTALGSGLCAPPHAGVSELAAVGVHPDHRRHGIAAALTAYLTAACPTFGIDRPFLTPAGEAEERIYRRVGYRERASMLHISVPR